MSQENKYRLYTAEDIISYLEGKMSPVEMRQIEMAALDDAFLQDAMDGYRLELEKGNKTPLMSSLEKVQAQQRVSRQKPASVIPFFRAGIFKWAVAAVLLVGTGFLWFNLNRTHPENAPADNSIVLQNSEQMDSTSLSDVAIATVPGAPEAEQNSPSASARPIENNKLKNSPILAAQSKQETNGADIKNAIDRRGVLVTPPIASADKLQKLNNTETKTESFYLKDAASSSVASASSIQTEPAGARNS